MEHKVHHRPSSRSESDNDSTESGNESPNAAMQFVDGVLEENSGESNRDFPNSEFHPISSFTFNNANGTGQPGCESLAQSHNPNEPTNLGEQLTPQKVQDMGSYDYEMSDEDDSLPSNYPNQQSMSPVKEPVKGRDI